MIPLDLKGQHVGRLHVQRRTNNNKYGQAQWECQCTCGNIAIVTASKLKSGYSQSCGCFQREQLINSVTTHGMAKRRKRAIEYSSWGNMIQRCSNVRNPRYKYWGGRGITVCDRWLKFENFYKDMGLKPGPYWSIERINNDGNYEPGNCRWATQAEQVKNRREFPLQPRDLTTGQFLSKRLEVL